MAVTCHQRRSLRSRRTSAALVSLVEHPACLVIPVEMYTSLNLSDLERFARLSGTETLIFVDFGVSAKSSGSLIREAHFSGSCGILEKRIETSPYRLRK